MFFLFLCLTIWRMAWRSTHQGPGSALKSITPLKARISPICLAAPQPHLSQMRFQREYGGKKKKKNPSQSLLHSSCYYFPTPSRDWKRKVYVSLGDKRPGNDGCVSVRGRRGKEVEISEETMGERWRESQKRLKRVLCNHHFSPRTMFYKTNEPWLL